MYIETTTFWVIIAIIFVIICIIYTILNHKILELKLEIQKAKESTIKASKQIEKK
jgi:preprotein translocase subunit SecG